MGLFGMFNKGDDSNGQGQAKIGGISPRPAMTFEQLCMEVKQLKPSEIRTSLAELMVVVFDGTEIDKLNELLDSYFGAPVKPSGAFPSREVRKVAEPYGGIMKNQTMYYIEFEDAFNCVMQWPWEGGQKVTVKILEEKKTAS